MLILAFVIQSEFGEFFHVSLLMCDVWHNRVFALKCIVFLHIEKQCLSGDICIGYFLKKYFLEYERSFRIRVSQFHMTNAIDPPKLWFLLVSTEKLTDIGCSLICFRNLYPHITWGFFLFLSLSLLGQLSSYLSEQSERI